MKSIAFIDTEIEPKKKTVLDIGGIKENGSSMHSNSVSELIKFLHGTEYVCGHNIINHDLKYIGNAVCDAGVEHFIDTLYFSPLLFATKPYHALLKDDKIQSEDTNNPLNDSKKAKNLFFDEVESFKKLDEDLKQIYYNLLKDKKEFKGFFKFIDYHTEDKDVEKKILDRFHGQICEGASISKIVSEKPIELSYCLALINTKDRYSITPPWVLKNYPAVENVMFLLRRKPCIRGCVYCNKAHDFHKGLKKFFGFDSFKTFGGEPLQEKAVKAAIDNKSLLAIFPTGGGKSITFQVPALMSGLNSKGLTVVISPLQSLMKDQVDNLEKAGITDAVTINGLLDPIERANSFERVENGSASILYISPESLRSRTIERLLLGRKVVRFVIDEAHCFSAWGQDFRVDYLYIGDFIKSMQEKKNLEDGIPVSCFTATAKQKVIEDIKEYFKKKLSIDLEVLKSNAKRVNLNFKVLEKGSNVEKYDAVRDLIDANNCPTIIYVSRTKRAYELAKRLTEDGYPAKPYHGKMDKHEKTKNQNEFISGDVQIMVATSAFGMGVDKKDVGLVIHFDISDSLENYIQEAGRAGRDEKIQADCYVLFNEEDLNKHFVLLNQTRLNIQEIQQIWTAIKRITKFRSNVSQSALELARKAGWDDSIAEIETRVRTAISALEEAGYLKRGHNMPRIYADSILTKNAQEAITKINESDRFDEKQKVQAVRIIKKLYSSRSRKHLSDEEAESRVDYISDHLAIVKEDVIRIVNLLREEKILAQMKDLSAYIKRSENKNRSLNILKTYWQIENVLCDVFENEVKTFHIKELNELAEENGCKDANPNKIINIINIWAIKNLIKRQKVYHSKNHYAVISNYKKEELKSIISRRYEISRFILQYLFKQIEKDIPEDENNKEEVLVEFSVLELKKAFEGQVTLFSSKTTIDEVEDALFFLSRISALKIEGGFLVVYNPMSIERIEIDNKRRYKAEDYEKLKQFYENKINQIHIVGEYANKMITDYMDALQFVDDYFMLNYYSFLNKYFKGSRKDEIRRNITPSKFKQLFGELSPVQLKIINDKDQKYIVVAAGPGSGKTRILVHKLASLLLMEDVKHEQLLMVTFSRSSATEFKKRLLKLIGNAANYIEIKTFHSYCFDLLGRVGTIEKSGQIIKEAIKRIENGDVDSARITKTVLVIDEAQDMDSDEFALISALMDKNEDMRVIAVGDDDQNIYEFRGSSSKYLESMISDKKAVMYELVENYRSKSNLVNFTNQFVRKLKKRLKVTPIVPVQQGNGNIKITKHKNSNLITPLVNGILSTDFSGTTCVLTKTNEEALQITNLLLENGMPAKLIQTNEIFNLYNLLEVRYFIHQANNLSKDGYTINDDDWTHARKKMIDRFKNTSNLEVCINLIHEFEATTPYTKYKSDLEIFIRESKLDDFYSEKLETIFVSTIHKAKGREFDNVFIVLDRFDPQTDEEVRLLYVAMTRAKQNLTIHYNGNYLDFIKEPGLKSFYDSNQYLPLSCLSMQLSHKDVVLDFFISHQNSISNLNGGDELSINDCFCIDSKGQEVLKFSKHFMSQIDLMKQKNYSPTKAKVRFIVFWKKEDAENEIRIILPVIYFEKQD